MNWTGLKRIDLMTGTGQTGRATKRERVFQGFAGLGRTRLWCGLADWAVGLSGCEAHSYILPLAPTTEPRHPSVQHSTSRQYKRGRGGGRGRRKRGEGGLALGRFRNKHG